MPDSFIDSTVLNDELRILILTHILPSDLRRLSSVSKKWKLFLSDEHVWLHRLKIDFYFSTKEALHLKQKLNTNYKQVYYYCSLDRFEIFEPLFQNPTNDVSEQLDNVRDKEFSLKSTCSYLAKYGLTYNHLRGRYWIRGQALQWLMRLVDDMAYDIPTSFAILFDIFVLENVSIFTDIEAKYLQFVSEGIDASLCSASGYLIAQCKSQHEETLEGLSFYQLSALIEFREEDITVTQVRSVKTPDRNFIPVLGQLLRIEKLAIETAIATLNSLSALEVAGLELELRHEEVKQLSTLSQMQALGHNKAKGFTVNHLKNQGWFKHKEYRFALEHLHDVINLDYEEAMNILRTLTPQQAGALNFGFDYTCVSKLNGYHIQALQLLVKNIITKKGHSPSNEIISSNASHFYNKNWFNSEHHVFAICYLIARYNFTIPNALQAINNTNWIQILEITSFLHRNQQKLNNTPSEKINALLQLFREGLPKEKERSIMDTLQR